MAEYRGLTIRIGADTSRLTAAIKATQGAISDTQRNINQLKKALQLDPGNKNAAALYVKEIQSQAVATASRIEELRKSIALLGSNFSRRGENGDGTRSTIGELAEDADNAALSTRRAGQAIDDATRELASTYTNISKLSHETFDKTEADIAAKVEEFKAAGKSLREARIAAEEWARREGGVTFNVKNSNLEDIRAELARLVEHGKMTQAEMDETIAKIDRLKTTWQTYSDTLADAKDVQAIHNHQVEIARLEAQLKSLAQLEVEASRNPLAENLAESKRNLSDLGEGAARAVRNLQTLDRALEIDPGNVGAAVSRTEALEAAIAATESKASELGKIISAYESAGIDRIAAETGDLSQAFVDAKAQAVAAHEAVILIKSGIDLSDEALKQIRVDLGHTSAPWMENILAAKGLSEQLEIAEQAAKEADDALHGIESAIDYTSMVSDQTLLNSQLAKYNDQLFRIKNGTDTFDGLSQRLSVARAALDNTGAEADYARSRFEALDKAAKLEPGNLQVVQERTTALREAIEAARAKAEALKKIIDAYDAAGIGHVSTSTRNLSQELADAKQEARRAEEALKAMEKAADGIDSDEIEQMRDRVKETTDRVKELEQLLGRRATETSLTETNAQASELQGRIDSVAQSMTTSMFMALQQVGQMSKQMITEVVTATYDLEEAYTSMLKTVEGTDEQYVGLREAALDASLVNPVTADQILNVEALGGQLGFAIEELEEFQRVANGLEISTNMSWQDAATEMAQFFNIMDTKHEYVGNFGSAIVELGNNFATTESDISDMALRIAGAGATLKLSEADVLGLATALTSMGLTAEAGGSSISQIMIKIEKAVANGTDGIKKYAEDAGMSIADFVSYVDGLDDDSLKALAEKYDMTASQFSSATVDSLKQLELWAQTAGYDSAQEFADAWSGSPIEALQNIFKGLTPEALEDGTNLSLLLDELGVKTIRQSDVARRLANNADLLTEAVEASNDAWKDNVALDTEVARRNESLSGRMDVLTNHITRIKTELGEGLAPIVSVATDALGVVVQLLDELPDGAKTAITSFAGLTVVGATLGAVRQAILSFAGSEVTSVLGKNGVISSMVTNLFASIAAMPGKIAAMGTALTSGFAVPAIAAAAAIGILAVSIGKDLYDAKKKADELSDFNEQLYIMGNYAGDAKGASVGLLDSYKGIPDTSKSIKELTEMLRDYNEEVAKGDAEARKTYRNLENYRDVLEEYGDVLESTNDVESLSAGAKSKLQWALDGLNQELGTNYSLEDLVTGRYEDEQGTIEDLVGHIEDLITARQKEARAQADQNRLTAAYEAQGEAIDSYNAAHAKLAEMQQYYGSVLQSQIAEGYSQEEAKLIAANMVAAQYGTTIEDMTAKEEAARRTVAAMTGEIGRQEAAMERNTSLTERGVDVEKLQLALMDAQLGIDEFYSLTTEDFDKMVEECGTDIDKYVEWMQKFHDVHDTSGESIREFLKEVEKYGDTLQSAGADTERFVSKCLEMGVTTEDLARVGSDNFALLATACDGDVDKMVAAIEEYNAAELEGKDVEIDAEGNVVTGEAAKKVREAREENAKLGDKKISVTASGNAVDGTAYQSLKNLKSQIDGLNDKTISIVTNEFKNVISTKTEQATGGMNNRPVIPRHATGYIATGPTLTNQGWIGEDGIEAVANWATGGAVVPLTNRKYMLPIADAIADGMASRGGTGGDTYTIYINDARINDDAEIQAALLGLLTTMKRKGAMDRG